jgi:hypothetical protein
MTTQNAGISDLAATPNDAEHAGLWFAYNSVAGLPEDMSGYRSINTLYRQTKDMKAKGIEAIPNVMVRVPTAHLTEQVIVDNIPELAPYFLHYLQTEESDYTKAQHKAGSSRMFPENYTLPSILSRLVAAGKGPQLTAEQIASWFNTEIADALATGLAAKYFPEVQEDAFTDDQCSKLNALVNGFQAKFLELADDKTEHIALGDRGQMTKAIEIAEAATTTLGSRFLAKFADMATKDAGVLGGL